MRKPVTFRFDAQLLESARKRASADNRSLTNYIETAVLRALETVEGTTDSFSNKQERKGLDK